MTDDERTQFIARTPPPPVALRHDDDDDGDDGKQRRTGLIWAAVVIVLLLLIGLGAYAIVFLGKDDKAAMETVPSLIGKTPAAAVQAISNANLKAVLGDPTSGACDGGQTGEEGKVCTQTPGANASVKKGSEVVYHLYTVKKTQVPNVQGKSYADASTALEGVGLKAKQVNVNNEAPQGQVLGQNPAPFATVPVGDTVTLKVSTGKVVLPNVEGMLKADAISTLNQMQFTSITTSIKQTPLKDKDGKVAHMEPTPGIAYPINQQITLIIYEYVPRTPSCTPDTGPSTGDTSGGTGQSSPATPPTSPPTSPETSPDTSPSTGSTCQS